MAIIICSQLIKKLNIRYNGKKNSLKVGKKMLWYPKIFRTKFMKKFTISGFGGNMVGDKSGKRRRGKRRRGKRRRGKRRRGMGDCSFDDLHYFAVRFNENQTTGLPWRVYGEQKIYRALGFGSRIQV